MLHTCNKRNPAHRVFLGYRATYINTDMNGLGLDIRNYTTRSSGKKGQHQRYDITKTTFTCGKNDDCRMSDEHILGTAYESSADVAQTWTCMILSVPCRGAQQRSNASQLVPFVSEHRTS